MLSGQPLQESALLRGCGHFCAVGRIEDVDEVTALRQAVSRYAIGIPATAVLPCQTGRADIEARTLTAEENTLRFQRFTRTPESLVEVGTFGLSSFHTADAHRDPPWRLSHERHHALDDGVVNPSGYCPLRCHFAPP
jgi:hypothetical protein